MSGLDWNCRSIVILAYWIPERWRIKKHTLTISEKDVGLGTVMPVSNPAFRFTDGGYDCLQSRAEVMEVGRVLGEELTDDDAVPGDGEVSVVGRLPSLLRSR